MFNFLPAEYKKSVRREYTFRFLTVLFGSLAVFFLVSIFLLAPSYLLAQNRYGITLSEETEVANAVATQKENNTGVGVKKVSAYIAAVDSLTPLSPQNIVEPIASAKPTGVSVSSISIGTANSSVAVSITGLSGTRDELLAFVKALQGVADFENVDLPVSYLALDKNINYSITFFVAKPTSKI